MNTRDIEKDIVVYFSESAYTFSATFEVKAYVRYEQVDGSPYEDIVILDMDSTAIEATYYDHEDNEWQWRYGENMPRKISKAFESHADGITAQIRKRVMALAEATVY
jgi:hypothetical protein